MFKFQYILFFCSFLVTFISIYFLIKNANKLNLVDHPNNRKIHKISTPQVGGLGIVISFSLIFLVSFIINFKIIDISLFESCVLVLSSLIIIMTGFIDDTKGITAFNKFLFQVTASIILVLGVKDLQFIDWPFSIYFDSIFYNSVLSIFYIVSILNAINLIDGLD